MPPPASQTGDRARALANGRALLPRDPANALVQAEEMLRVDPGDPDAHLLAASALRRLGREADARQASLAAATNGASAAPLRAALAMMAQGRLGEAEQSIRARLNEQPDDSFALNMLAEIARKAGRMQAAEELLERALALAPDFVPTRAFLAALLSLRHEYPAAIAHYEAMEQLDPGNRDWPLRKAAAQAKIGAYDQALETYEALLAGDGTEPGVWTAYGHVLKTVGRRAECEAAYRRAIAADPGAGEAWWSIANIKTAAFDESDVAQMEAARSGALSPKARTNLLFALGHAYERRGDYSASFDAYREANRVWHAEIGYDADWLAARARDLVENARPPQAAAEPLPGPAPIFIIGMPRAGSTLVEQMLASHSRIVGTSELPYLPALALELEGRKIPHGGSFARAVADLAPDEAQRIGAEYLRLAAPHHAGAAPWFIDKTPNNWLLVPLIWTALPHARIIDVRREAMACCYSNFKQHYAQGQAFSYDLRDLGRYYADYVGASDHLRHLAPERMHLLRYEALVADPEAQLREALAFLGLEFEPACLDFHSNTRAVRTASAEQVRRPIDRAGNAAWQPFAQWLGPLREALGPLAEAQP